MVKRSVWKMSRFGSRFYRRHISFSKCNADCGRRYLDIKTKKGVGDIQKQVRLYPVNLDFPRMGIKSSRKRSQTDLFGTVQMGGCGSLFIQCIAHGI